jgi:hypothetical protein
LAPSSGGRAGSRRSRRGRCSGRGRRLAKKARSAKQPRREKKPGRKRAKATREAFPEQALERAGSAADCPRTNNDRARRAGPSHEQTSTTAITRHHRPLRTVIFHYHLFKNAGTSVDELLRRNFGSRWATQEFSSNRRDNAIAVAEFIRGNPHLAAISSHTALLPAPQIEGSEIFPVIFIRHPIDRLRSAYEFERGQRASTRGARLAKTHDLRGYLDTLLQPPRSRQARNFQTYRLALSSPGHGSYRERALQTINTLPFIGLVDAFEKSVRRMSELLAGRFPDFAPSAPHANAQATVSQLSLAERLAAIRSSVGEEFYEQLVRSNADDLYIYESVSALYRGTSPPVRQSPAS